MSDRNEAQVAKDKAAVAAMRGAQSAMVSVLDRVSVLERELAEARSFILNVKPYIGEYACWFVSQNSPQRKVRDLIDEAASKIGKVLA